ncbi:hypothetical protein [Streptomyces sp. DW26H14]|uniref:hypothetical protein n=1 Tax=Streptomyces sp. DW26H14 TaxID=3435395 RepID=UPI00403D6E57
MPSTTTATTGAALLIAAEAPPQRRRAPYAVAAALPALAAVSPAALVGATYASVVQLVAPDDPQVVLSHLRTAAAAEGPLVLYVGGELVLDVRGAELHLALARTAARTVRYTAMPWQWIAGELENRRAPTVIYADLTADADVWQALAEEEHPLAGPYEAYGTVQVRDRRHVPEPRYTHALAHVLRTAPGRLPGIDVHRQAARESALHPDTTVWLGALPAAPAPAAVPRPAPAPAPAAEAEAAPPLDPVLTVAPAPPPEPVVDPRPAPAPEAEPPASAAPTEPPPAPAEPPCDPHRAITAALEAGRHPEALAIAQRCEDGAARRYGVRSPEAARWVGVRAHLAHTQGDMGRACALWLASAGGLLRGGVPADHPDVRHAADSAHASWRAAGPDHPAAEQHGQVLAALRRVVPGPPGAAADVRRRLARLAQRH